MTDVRKEPPYVRYAWIVLLLVSVLSLWIGFGDFTKAGDADPALIESVSGITWTELQLEHPPLANLVNLLSRLVGALWIGLSALSIVVSATGYRRGELWAWYGLWVLPLVMLLIFATFLFADLAQGASRPPALYSAPGLFALATLALLLPARKFLTSRRQPENPA